MIKSEGRLKGQFFLEPIAGEEHQVAMLYAVLAQFVDPDSSWAEYWYKVRTLSGAEGIDSMAVPLKCDSLDPRDFKNLEFKWRFAPTDEYNHALILTNRIVAWDIDNGSKVNLVKDRFGWYGEWEMSQAPIAGRIKKILHTKGKTHQSDVEVVSLKELVSESFDVEWYAAPPKSNRATG
jgi:hypothetical protein